MFIFKMPATKLDRCQIFSRRSFPAHRVCTHGSDRAGCIKIIARSDPIHHGGHACEIYLLNLVFACTKNLNLIFIFTLMVIQ